MTGKKAQDDRRDVENLQKISNMEFRIKENEEFIKLGQLLKAADLVRSGSDAKTVIQNGDVEVNGEVCLLRGKKVKRGDLVSFDGKTVKVC